MLGHKDQCKYFALRFLTCEHREHELAHATSGGVLPNSA